MSENKKTFTVTLEVKEMIFDIMNKTHLTGQAREAANQANYEAASYMQASEDDEADYQIRRSITNAFAELKVLLGAYLDENKTATTNLVAEQVDSGGQLVMSFKMPSHFRASAVDCLGQGCHRFIVNTAIADWFTITNKADAPEYVTMAQSALDTARRALYKRERPLRPVY